jgi:hypothetical protein
MTDLTEVGMTDRDEGAASNGRRVLLMMLAGLGIIMTGGAIVGFLAAHNEDGGGALSVAGVIALGTFVAIIGGLAYSIWRNAQNLKQSGDPLTRRERLNNRIVAGSGVFGALLALVLAMAGDINAGNPDIFSDGPISPVIAIIVAFTFGVLAPLLSWYWHARVIDEQEDAAYRSGALLAIYAFWFVAPVWWFLWRGGILPAPDGVALYMMTTFIALIVWFWKKYR